jgi:hypothetical protein
MKQQADGETIELRDAIQAGLDSKGWSRQQLAGWVHSSDPKEAKSLKRKLDKLLGSGAPCRFSKTALNDIESRLGLGKKNRLWKLEVLRNKAGRATRDEKAFLLEELESARADSPLTVEQARLVAAIVQLADSVPTGPGVGTAENITNSLAHIVGVAARHPEMGLRAVQVLTALASRPDSEIRYALMSLKAYVDGCRAAGRAANAK